MASPDPDQVPPPVPAPDAPTACRDDQTAAAPIRPCACEDIFLRARHRTCARNQARPACSWLYLLKVIQPKLSRFTSSTGHANVKKTLNAHCKCYEVLLEDRASIWPQAVRSQQHLHCLYNLASHTLGGLARTFLKADDEAATMGLHGFQVHSPALVLTDTLDQRQAKSKALAPLFVTAHERQEHCFALFFRNAHARVFNRKSMLEQGQTDKPPVGVMQRIAQQIAHHRIQESRVVTA